MGLKKKYKDLQFYKFCAYGFLKNLRFFEPFFILFLLEKGLTFTQIGFLYSIREITKYLFEIPTGIIADALGRKKTMLWSFVAYIFSFLTFYFASHFAALAVAMIFFAFGDAFRTGTHKAMIFEYLKIKSWEDRRVDYYGGTRSCSQLGSALSSLIAAVIVFYGNSYQTVFLVSTLPYILNILLLLSYPDNLNGKITGKGIPGIRKRIKQILADLAENLKDKRKLKILFNVSSLSGYYKQTKDYLQYIIQTLAATAIFLPAMNEKQRTALLTGIVFFILYLLTGRASKSAGNVRRLFSSSEKALNVLLFAGVSAGLLGGIFLHFSLYLPSILFITAIYLIENFRNPAGVDYIAQNFKQENLATTLSTNSLIKTVYSAFLAVIFGWLSDMFDVGTAFSLVSAFMLIIALFIKLK